MTKFSAAKRVSTGLANTALRALGLVARFALTIYLAKYLDLRVVGAFGLVYAVVTTAPALLGLGLNFSLNREIIGLPVVEAGSRIRDRLIVTAGMATLAAAAITILLATGLVKPIPNVGWLLGIALLEVVAFDIHMSLISLQMSVFANFLLFIRTASWIYPYIGLGLIVPTFRSFSLLVYFWYGALIATYVSLFVGLRHWPWASIYRRPVDSSAIIRRIGSSILIYASDLGIVGSAFLDRFIVGYGLGIEVAGIFVFYWSLANSVQLLVNVGWVQTSLPRWVHIFNSKGRSGLAVALKGDMRLVITCGSVLSILVLVVVLGSVSHLGRPRLTAYPWLFPLMLVAAVLRLASDVVNYGLYACGLDRQWALSNMLGIALSAMFTVIGLQTLGLQGVGLAMIGTSTSLLAVRLYYLLRTTSEPAIGRNVQHRLPS